MDDGAVQEARVQAVLDCESTEQGSARLQYALGCSSSAVGKTSGTADERFSERRLLGG